jgi:hypothetical protein
MDRFVGLLLRLIITSQSMLGRHIKNRHYILLMIREYTYRRLIALLNNLRMQVVVGWQLNMLGFKKMGICEQSSDESIALVG